MANDIRQLRERIATLGESVDRLGRPSDTGTAKRLVQVYDGGAMGTGPDVFYLTNPVELDGDEVEGGSGSGYAVDTLQTIPVVFLGSTPSVGDIVPAFAIGGRWVAEKRGGQCCCEWWCSGSPPDSIDLVDSVWGPVNLPRTSCKVECGSETFYCFYQGTILVDWPGNSQSPPIANLPVTYTITCCNGGGFQPWKLEIQWPLGPNYQCPGSPSFLFPLLIQPQLGGYLPRSVSGAGFLDYGWTAFGLGCLEGRPWSQTTTISYRQSFAVAGLDLPAWTLYGGDCDVDAISVTYTMSEGPTTQNCGCVWWCPSLPAPAAINLTDSKWGSVSLAKITLPPGHCNDIDGCIYRGTLLIDWPGNSLFPPISNFPVTYTIYPYPCEDDCTTLNWRMAVSFPIANSRTACEDGTVLQPMMIGGLEAPISPAWCGWLSVPTATTLDCGEGEPYSQTMTVIIPYSAMITPDQNAAWTLYGGDCGATASITVTFTLSQP